MKQSRFTEEQIIGILKEHETGVSVADLCRKHGVSDATVYKWKARFGGMEVSEAKRLKAQEEENSNPERPDAERKGHGSADAIPHQAGGGGPMAALAKRAA